MSQPKGFKDLKSDVHLCGDCVEDELSYTLDEERYEPLEDTNGHYCHLCLYDLEGGDIEG